MEHIKIEITNNTIIVEHTKQIYKQWRKQTIKIKELSANQKKAIDHIKEIYGTKWKQVLIEGWKTDMHRYGLNSTETKEMQKLKNTINK